MSPNTEYTAQVHLQATDLPQLLWVSSLSESFCKCALQSIYLAQVVQPWTGPAIAAWHTQCCLITVYNSQFIIFLYGHPSWEGLLVGERKTVEKRTWEISVIYLDFLLGDNARKSFLKLVDKVCESKTEMLFQTLASTSGTNMWKVIQPSKNMS